MSDSSPHISPQERADAIRERVSHIARGCRAHTSHQPDVYLIDIEMYLDGFVEQLEAATKQRDAIMAMLEAERPPEEVFAYARSLSNTAAGSRERDLSLGPISPPASDPALGLYEGPIEVTFKDNYGNVIDKRYVTDGPNQDTRDADG